MKDKHKLDREKAKEIQKRLDTIAKNTVEIREQMKKLPEDGQEALAQYYNFVDSLDELRVKISILDVVLGTKPLDIHNTDFEQVTDWLRKDG